MNHLFCFAVLILPGLLFIIFSKPLARAAARNMSRFHRWDAGGKFYNKHYRVECVGFGLVWVGFGLYCIFFLA